MLISKNGKITISEFNYGCEHLLLRLSNEEMHSVFNFLDQEGKGEIEYQDFCRLCDEKRNSKC